jgi:mannan endo-1,4-beta-mannosidase
MNISHRNRTMAATSLAAALVAIAPVTSVAKELKDFVTRQGDQLMVGDEPFRFVSFNIPNLLVVEDAFEFTKPSPWRWPDEFEIEDALESVRQMGGQVVRTYVISVRREGSDMGDTVHVLAPGEFNEEGFRALDKVLEVAGRKGIRIIIPLVDNWKWMGGVPQYAAFRGKPPEAFWSDPELIADFKRTIEYVLNRKNTYTGKLYRDDPAIFGWETGNEIDATADWTREIAATIKQLAPNHLVIDGRSLHGISPWQLEEPNTDVLTTHHYPHPTPDFVPAITKAHAAMKGKKPYVVGEFGFVDTPRIRSVIDAVVNDDISGGLLWSLRFHRREGGFYWHMEVGTGGNFYKAYHWPGFASGDAYGEREVLDLMRDNAFAIRGQLPPPIELPAAPTLLAIVTPAAISWQGSAGASSYDVERATTAAGPWSTIAQNVSDADTQYRPLFSDGTVEPGATYFYRILARNSAGASPPSDVVGPVAAKCRTLVDECVDLSLVADTKGDVVPRSDNARQTQEDAHRLALPPGGDIVYQVDEPIQAFRIYGFAGGVADLQVSASADGKNFADVEMDRKSFNFGQGDYGYKVPVLFTGAVETSGPTYLKFSLPAATAEPVQLSRVEIEYGGR